MLHAPSEQRHDPPLCFAASALSASPPPASKSPPYQRPTAAVPPDFKEAPPAGWKEAQPSDGALRGKWWEIYNDPALNALEEQVSISNQNVLQAEAQFREAKAAVRIARSALFPTGHRLALRHRVRKPPSRLASRVGPSSPLRHLRLPGERLLHRRSLGQHPPQRHGQRRTPPNPPRRRWRMPACSISPSSPRTISNCTAWMAISTLLAADRQVLPGVSGADAEPLRRRHRLR